MGDDKVFNVEGSDSFFEKFMKYGVDDESRIDLSKSLSEFEWLSEFVPELTIACAEGMEPFQAEGLVKGLPYYYKSRGSSTILRVNHEGASDAYSSVSLYSSSLSDFGDEYCGGFWLNNLLNLVEGLERSPYLYEFMARSVVVDSRSSEEVEFVPGLRDNLMRAWGFSEVDAYRRVLDGCWSFPAGSWGTDVKKRFVEALDVSSVSLNDDDRVFPDVVPDFSLEVPGEWRDENGWIRVPEGLLKRFGVL